MQRALPLALLLAALAAAPAAAVRSQRRLRVTGAAPAACGAAAYAEWRRRHAEALAAENSSASESRQALFANRCKAVLAQNANVNARWKATINRFADRTHAELRAHFGYKRTGFGDQPSGVPSMSSMPLPIAESSTALQNLPEVMDWRKQLKSAWHVRDQGSCGSCWAMAASGAAEMHAELAGGGAEMVSASQLVQCMPNPRRCGGSGGCDGATAELAFQYMKQHGVVVEQGLGHSARSGLCELRGRRRVTVGGFVQLPANRGLPLLVALATKGPVAVGVDASDWFPYHSGIFDACHRDAVVNHAVLAVGYTKDAYVIRNSWGHFWGESGHIRLLRLDGTGDGHCGVDRNPEEGSACVGGPSEVPVCGMCGVLSESAYPVGVHFVDEASAYSGELRGSPQPPAGSGREPGAAA